MLYGDDRERTSRGIAGWAMVAVLYIGGALFLWWLHEQVKPRELFAPRYEQHLQTPTDTTDIS